MEQASSSTCAEGDGARDLEWPTAEHATPEHDSALAAAVKAAQRISRDFGPIHNALRTLLERERASPSVSACVASLEKVRARVVDVQAKGVAAAEALGSAGIRREALRAHEALLVAALAEAGGPPTGGGGAEDADEDTGGEQCAAAASTSGIPVTLLPLIARVSLASSAARGERHSSRPATSPLEPPPVDSPALEPSAARAAVAAEDIVAHLLATGRPCLAARVAARYGIPEHRLPLVIRTKTDGAASQVRAADDDRHNQGPREQGDDGNPDGPVGAAADAPSLRALRHAIACCLDALDASGSGPTGVEAAKDDAEASRASTVGPLLLTALDELAGQEALRDSGARFPVSDEDEGQLSSFVEGASHWLQSTWGSNSPETAMWATDDAPPRAKGLLVATLFHLRAAHLMALHRCGRTLSPVTAMQYIAQHVLEFATTLPHSVQELILVVAPPVPEGAGVAGEKGRAGETPSVHATAAAVTAAAASTARSSGEGVLPREGQTAAMTFATAATALRRLVAWHRMRSPFSPPSWTALCQRLMMATLSCHHELAFDACAASADVTPVVGPHRSQGRSNTRNGRESALLCRALQNRSPKSLDSVLQATFEAMLAAAASRLASKRQHQQPAGRVAAWPTRAELVYDLVPHLVMIRRHTHLTCPLTGRPMRSDASDLLDTPVAFPDGTVVSRRGLHKCLNSIEGGRGSVGGDGSSNGSGDGGGSASGVARRESSQENTDQASSAAEVGTSETAGVRLLRSPRTGMVYRESQLQKVFII